jgi:hypothetical protein
MATRLASRGHNIVIGSAGIDIAERTKGYIGTICVVVDDQDPTKVGDIEFHDTHVTRSQLEQLRTAIDKFLEMQDRRENAW